LLTSLHHQTKQQDYKKLLN